MAKDTKTPKLTLKMRRLLTELQKNGLNIKKACEAVSVSRNAHYEYLKNIQYFTQYEYIKKSTIEDAEAILYSQLETNPTLLMFFLRAKGGYIEKSSIEIQEHLPVPFPSVDELFGTPDDDKPKD